MYVNFAVYVVSIRQKFFLDAHDNNNYHQERIQPAREHVISVEASGTIYVLCNIYRFVLCDDTMIVYQ